MADMDLEDLHEAFSFARPIAAASTHADSDREPESELLDNLASRDPFSVEAVPKGKASTGAFLKGINSAGLSRDQNTVVSAEDVTWQTCEATICTIRRDIEAPGELHIPLKS